MYSRFQRFLTLLLIISLSLFWLRSNAQQNSLAQAQPDSLYKARQDSLLRVQQLATNKLLTLADSIRIADSLEQAAILQQITDLRVSDEKRKAELQAQLDSISKVRQERERSIKQQVDSLRVNIIGVPVIAFKDTLFYIYSRLGPYSPNDRAANIAQKLELLVDQNVYDPNELLVFEGEESHDIVHTNIIILSITDRDAFWLDKSREEVAEDYVQAIKRSIADYYERTGLKRILTRVAMLLLVLAGLILGITLMNTGLNSLIGKLIKRSSRFFKGIKLRKYEFLSAEKEKQLVVWLLYAFKWIVIIMVIYLGLPIIFSIFPATKGIATTLLNYLLNPLKRIGSAFVDYIPELFYIAVIIVVTHYVIRILRFFALEVERGKLVLSGFYPDWARPTFSLLRILIYAFAFIVIFPYLPGSDSPVFQGVSVFFGLLLSLGSTSAISNIIAGLVMTYMRPFRIGDRVKIGNTTGDVLEKSLLVTRLRTIKNEDVTIPNSAILNEKTVNYSSSVKELGLILHTTVTIGYDVPWRKVHELLLRAALNTEFVKQEPGPFVLQTSLDDFYVSYQINAYTEQASKAAKIYSDLYSNIQDAFNEAGVEILSPHYRAARDGNMVTIPAEYLPPEYKVPPFNIQVKKDEPD